MKKKSNYAIIILFFLGFYFMTMAFSPSKVDGIAVEEPLMKLFEESGASILETNVTTTLTVADTLWTEEEVQSIKEELKVKLALNHTKEVIVENPYHNFDAIDTTTEEDNILFIHQFSDIGTKQILATNTNKDGDITTFKVYSAEVQGEKTSYIIIDIIQNKRYKQIVEISNQSKEILEKYGDDIDTTVNMVGTYDKPMSKEERMKKIEEMILSQNAEKIEEVAEESYVSTTIYTPTITHSIQYAGKKVNLHLAMRYNDYEEKTYLYIATPLITMTY